MTTDWLGSLEDRVRDAAEELRRLREENDGLRSRVERLEADGGSPALADGEAPAWSEERDAIRHRVQRLVEQLEELLQD